MTLASLNGPVRTNRRRPTALLCDDNPYNRELYSDILRSAGCSVTAAASGVEALEVVGAVPPDVAVIDIGLGDMSGFDLCRILTERWGLQSLPVVLISAHRPANGLERALEAGGRDLWTAPIDVHEMQHAVAQLVQPATLGRLPEIGQAEGNRLPVIQLFGDLGLRGPLGSTTIEPSKSGELVATLAAVAPDQVAGREMSMLLWPEADDDPARLAGAAVAGRAAFDSVGIADAIGFDGRHVWLDVVPADIDVLSFQAAARDLLRRPLDDPEADAREAMVLRAQSGPRPFGSIRSNVWVLQSRMRVLELRSLLQQRAAAALVLSGDTLKARSVAHALARNEPWRERNWAMLVVALSADGHDRAARWAVQEGRRSLAGEYGLRASTELDLVEAALDAVAPDEVLRHVHRLLETTSLPP